MTLIERSAGLAPSSERATKYVRKHSLRMPGNGAMKRLTSVPDPEQIDTE